MALTPEEFGSLFLLHRRSFWCVAAAVLSDRSSADDILQDAAATALTKLSQFDPSTNFTAWFSQIVRFVALNEFRRRQRRPSASATEFPDRASHAAQGSPADSSQHSSLSIFDQDVSTALSELDETARACLLLRTIQELPYREISLMLDIPEGTAMSHVHRARASLRKRLHRADRSEVTP